MTFSPAAGVTVMQIALALGIVGVIYKLISVAVRWLRLGISLVIALGSHFAWHQIGSFFKG